MLPHDEEFMKEYNKEVFEAGIRLLNLNIKHLDKGIKCLESNIVKYKQEISQLNIGYDLDGYVESIKKEEEERAKKLFVDKATAKANRLLLRQWPLKPIANFRKNSKQQQQHIVYTSIICTTGSSKQPAKQLPPIKQQKQLPHQQQQQYVQQTKQQSSNYN